MLELETAVVQIFFDAPGKRYGFAEILDPDSEMLTGEQMFFHLNDGQWVDIVGGDEIIWTGAVHSNGVRVPAPQQGAVIAFERAPGRDGPTKAKPWTYAEGYENCQFLIGATRVQIINDKNAELWSGYYNHSATRRPVLDISGKFPSELSDGFRVEMFVDDDIIDGPFEGEGTFIAGHWDEWPQGLHFLQSAMDEASMR